MCDLQFALRVKFKIPEGICLENAHRYFNYIFILYKLRLGTLPLYNFNHCNVFVKVSSQDGLKNVKKFYHILSSYSVFRYFIDF